MAGYDSYEQVTIGEKHCQAKLDYLGNFKGKWIRGRTECQKSKGYKSGNFEKGVLLSWPFPHIPHAIYLKATQSQGDAQLMFQPIQPRQHVCNFPRIKNFANEREVLTSSNDSYAADMHTISGKRHTKQL